MPRMSEIEVQGQRRIKISGAPYAESKGCLPLLSAPPVEYVAST